MEANEEKGLVQWIDSYINKAVVKHQPKISTYVAKLRLQNPGITDIELSKKIVSRKSLKNGLVGASTGVGGIITLPVTVPPDLLITWKMQIYLALTIAHIFGHTSNTTDLKTDVYLILAGISSKEVLKRFGIALGNGMTKKEIQKGVTREMMKKIWKVIPQKIITKAGEKSMTNFMKLVPLVGAPIGFGFDYVATNAVGKLAIKFYSN